MSHDYAQTSLPIFVKFIINELGSKVERRICKGFISLPFQKYILFQLSDILKLIKIYLKFVPNFTRIMIKRLLWVFFAITGVE